MGRRSEGMHVPRAHQPTPAQIRAQLPHPVIDADGHVLEFLPASLPHLREALGPEADAIEFLRSEEQRGARYDTIVLDPPAFAKQRKAVPKALAGYKEINLRALKLLNPGGHLVTCTCSAHVDEGMFGGVVLSAALDAGVPVAVVEKRMQSRDHPVLLGVPETYYLKCFVLRRVG